MFSYLTDPARFARWQGIDAELDPRPGGAFRFRTTAHPHYVASGRYVEYYAHLMGYAPNVKEGLAVQEGDVIGFVGTTGNASPDAPHLHFQVMRSDANYWNGTPIDVRGFMTKPGRMRN